MSYQFETLGDERFQQLCQAVLVSDHPNVQCACPSVNEMVDVMRFYGEEKRSRLMHSWSFRSNTRETHKDAKRVILSKM
jgi:hypothetical protein